MRSRKGRPSEDRGEKALWRAPKRETKKPGRGRGKIAGKEMKRKQGARKAEPNRPVAVKILERGGEADNQGNPESL